MKILFHYHWLTSHYLLILFFLLPNFRFLMVNNSICFNGFLFLLSLINFLKTKNCYYSYYVGFMCVKQDHTCFFKGHYPARLFCPCWQDHFGLVFVFVLLMPPQNKFRSFCWKGEIKVLFFFSLLLLFLLLLLFFFFFSCSALFAFVCAAAELFFRDLTLRVAVHTGWKKREKKLQVDVLVCVKRVEENNEFNTINNFGRGGGGGGLKNNKN